jgi:hypothetical protein
MTEHTAVSVIHPHFDAIDFAEVIRKLVQDHQANIMREPVFDHCPPAQSNHRDDAQPDATAENIRSCSSQTLHTNRNLSLGAHAGQWLKTIRQSRIRRQQFAVEINGVADRKQCVENSLLGLSFGMIEIGNCLLLRGARAGVAEGRDQ